MAGPRVSGSSASFDTIKAELNSYIWPTDASTRITSTFAEYRSTHFHGGIDISTNGHTGYKVFAVREGYVCRINIEPNGYGKIIYVRHPDGYVSCYAHLKSFSESIEKVSRAEQYRKGTYAIDLTLDSNQVPVQKGETIAYSGDTGFGPAHLHFELRDENLNPVNPLLIPTYHVYDVRPPYIRRFMIAPLAFGSTVDNSAVPKYYSRFPGTRTKRRIPQPIRIHGEIGFAIDAIDFGEYNAIHTGIHRIEFFFDDSLVYAMHLDHMPIDQTKQIDLHYDLPSVMAGRGDFQKLYIDEGNVLPFYDHRPQGSGVIITTHMNDGEHPFRVICYDFNENASELDGSVVIIHRPIMQIADVSDQSIGLKGNLLASISKCTVLGKRLSDTQWSQHTLDSDRFEVSNDEIELPVNSHPYDVLKVIAETRNGVQTMPMYYFKKKPHGSAQSAQLVVEPMLNYAKVSLTCKGMFTGTPVVKIKEGVLERTIELEPVDVNSYVGAFNPLDTYEGEREVIADVEVNGTQDELSKAFQLYEIPANKSGSFIFGNGELTIAYDSGAVYKPLSLQISREYFGNSYMYVLEPQDVLLNGGIKVSLAKPINQTSYRRTGLYSRTNRGWVFQTDSLDSEHNCYTTIFTRTLGDVAVLHDEQPPSIGRLRVIPKKGTVNVAFRYYDNLSGFDPDGVRITIDGRLAIPEIDGEHHLVTCVPDFELAPGKHLLKIAMKDMAKNETSIERVFKSR
ncbi:MAG TPA: M23 family metallopeptidase [Bacteroidota bacterium]|nr:M23 family metallopeptidase [Bacteroidota bacterium]